jgi:hypothetical protein
MTDRMEQLLQDAGRRWRATQPAPPEPDSSRWSRPARSPRPFRWVPLVATAGATAIVIGLGYVSVTHFSPGRHDRNDRMSGVTESAKPTARPSPPAPADLVVRDGDLVQASGMVLAAPGKPVRFCAPAPSDLVARVPDIPACTFGVEVTGVDLNRLAQAKLVAGVRFGDAALRGVWRSGVLHVTEQGPPKDPPPDMIPPPFPDTRTPCPPPAGGWKPVGDADNKALHQYVEEEHPDRFRRPWVSYPNGEPPGPTPYPNLVEVLVVEVVSGDVDEARRELQRRYAGNLCVVHNPGARSIADETAAYDAVQQVLDPLMHDFTNGIYASGGPYPITVELVMLTPQLYEKLGVPRLALVFHPWLRPVR